jgi:hypothetical protein
VAGGHSSQKNLEREGVSGHRGDPWSHTVSSIAPLQHGTIPRQALVTLRTGRQKMGIAPPACVSPAMCDELATTAV